MESESKVTVNQDDTQQSKQNILPVSEMLTKAEIESLRQNKKELNAYKPKAFEHLGVVGDHQT